MRQAWLLPLACVLGLAQSGPGIDVQKITHGVEQHYNNLKSLQVNFTETRIDRGGRRRPATGVLYLEKPRKMRWEYSSQPGRFFLSDGNFDYDYDPTTKEVERSKVKEADDLRGPLAFLLGKVDFDRDFGSYSTDGADGAITATPKSDKLLFTGITFTAGTDFSIKKLSVQGLDGSTTSFVFDGEVANPSLKESLFKFVLPPGAVVVDGSKQ
jgi:outer membrane lipoprotein-sorting protein